MQLQFLGAAGTVTGSKTLLSSGDVRVLIDCGMFQGFKHLRRRNWEALEVLPSEIDAVVLTHAHLDHVGWLPVLVREGFRGPVFCTEATAALAKIILSDSAHIQEEDAKRANRKGYTRHQPAKPLYTEADAKQAIQRFDPIPWGETIHLGGSLKLTLHPAGHILGASMARLEDHQASVLFSGDLGRPDDRVMCPPHTPDPVDYLVLESTYGGRAHADDDPLEALAEIARRTIARGGVLLIPSFAVGRAQALLWALHLLMEDGRIPEVDVVLDSPMAVETTDLYRPFHDNIRLTERDVRALRREVYCTRTAMESKQLNGKQGPFVLVSASGMLTGGRVLHHVAARAGSPRNTLLFVGYQAPGTRGGNIVRGESKIKFHGEWVPIECEVATIDGFSAHADQDEALAWLRGFAEPPTKVWLNHGEPESSEILRTAIAEQLGWEAELAREGVVFQLDPSGELSAEAPKPPVAAPPRPLPAAPLAPSLAQAAGLDAAFLAREELRPARLLLAAEQVQTTLRDQGIEGLVAVLGKPMHEGEPCMDQARELGRALVLHPALKERCWRLATTARPGIAAAVTEGARLAGGTVAGFHAALPGEPLPHASTQPRLCFRFEHPALRDLMLLERCAALIAFPGDLDTAATVLRALDLARAGRLGDVPLILVDGPWWGSLLQALDVGSEATAHVHPVEDGGAAVAALLDKLGAATS
jgi:metallo-beta-lactamase family protein